MKAMDVVLVFAKRVYGRVAFYFVCPTSFGLKSAFTNG